MKLWLLKKKEFLESGDDPWDIRYDDTFNGFVIRARTENEARILASQVSEQRGAGESMGRDISPWEDEKYTTCVELLPKGRSEIVLEDYTQG